MRVVAGVGCRLGCPAEAIVAAVRRAAEAGGVTIDVLAAPAFKRDEPGLHGAAAALGLRLEFIDAAALAAAQAGCVTRSDVVERATGFGSIAEAAALALSGGRLLVPRIGRGAATCAVAGP